MDWVETNKSSEFKSVLHLDLGDREKLRGSGVLETPAHRPAAGVPRARRTLSGAGGGAEGPENKQHTFSVTKPQSPALRSLTPILKTAFRLPAVSTN